MTTMDPTAPPISLSQHQIQEALYEEALLSAYAADVVGMHWQMQTIDARKFGATREAGEQGLLIAKFDPGTTKIKEIELIFDVINAMHEVETALPLPWLATVPNSLSDTTFDSHYEARVVTSASRPFIIANANNSWLDLCGFSTKRDCIGLSLNCIQGPDTDMERVDQLCAEIEAGRAADAMIINYTKTGRKFLNYIRAFPLYPDVVATKPTHFLGILSSITERKNAVKRALPSS